MKYFQILILLTVVSPFLACHKGSDSKAPELFPQSNEIHGFERTGEVQTFDASNLWEYIDGGAEKYIQAGLQKTLTADYVFNETIEIVVDIYHMDTPEVARQIFESEAPADSLRIQLGHEAQLTRSSLTFWKDAYFVRLISFQDTPEVQEALAALGKAIEKKIAAQEVAG
ncbi:MAG: DUF6599 family protein [bacterium]